MKVRVKRRKIRLHFDILDDLSDEQELLDYFVFMSVSDLTYELNYKLVKRVEYYLSLGSDVSDRVGEDGDLEVVKFIDRWCPLEFMERPLDPIIEDAINKIRKARNRIRTEALGVVDSDEQDGTNLSRYIWMFRNACWNGHLEMVEWIYGNKYDLIVRGLNDIHLTELTIQKGHLDVAKWLYQNVHGPDHDGWRDLDASAESGHLEMVKWLHYSNVKITNIPTCMHKACVEGHLEVAKFLYEVRKVGFTGFELTDACVYGHFEIVKWILEETKGHPGVDMDLPIAHAFYHGHMKIVEYLINDGRFTCSEECIVNMRKKGYSGLANEMQRRYNVAGGVRKLKVLGDIFKNVMRLPT